MSYRRAVFKTTKRPCLGGQPLDERLNIFRDGLLSKVGNSRRNAVQRIRNRLPVHTEISSAVLPYVRIIGRLLFVRASAV